MERCGEHVLLKKIKASSPVATSSTWDVKYWHTLQWLELDMSV